MAKKQTREEKALDRKIELIYYANCQNIPIDVFDIGRVFAAGRAAALAGGDDDAITRAVVSFVEDVRKDKPKERLRITASDPSVSEGSGT